MGIDDASFPLNHREIIMTDTTKASADNATPSAREEPTDFEPMFGRPLLLKGESREAPEDIAALFTSWKADHQTNGISPMFAFWGDWKLNRRLFQSGFVQPLPADSIALAASDRWVGVYTSAGAPQRQVAAITRSAKAAREISCIRAFRAAIISAIEPAYLSHKDLMKLVALDHCERLAKATYKRAQDYLERTAYDGPDVFCQDAPELRCDGLDKTIQ
jgi:hypothetical protein